MKKCIIVSLVGLFCFSQAYAKVELDGLGRVRSYTRDNYDFDEDNKQNLNQTEYRFQVGMKVSKTDNDKSYVFLQPRFSKTAAETTVSQSSGNLTNPNSFEVHQAFLAHKKKNVTLRAGRQELNYGDQLVIGAVGWHNIGRSFDGYKVSLDSKFGTTDALMMTIKESGAETDSNRDHNLKGIYHSGKAGVIHHLDLYYLVDDDQSDNVSDNQATNTTTGVRIKSKLGKIDYRVEYVSQSIEYAETTESGSLYDVELGYSLNKFRAAIESSVATDQYKQLYPTAHKWLGFADLFKRQNVEQTAVHFKYSMNDDLSFKLSHHMFQIHDEDATGHKWMYTGAESVDETELGTEQDLVVNYKLDSATKLQIVYSVFTPGKRFKEAGNDDVMTFSYLQLQTNF